MRTCTWRGSSGRRSAVTVWLIPSNPPSEQARRFRELWARRWLGTHPRYLNGIPDSAFSDHRHAYPDFRCPLSAAEEIEANRAFQRDVIARLAGTETDIVMVTFDWHWAEYDDVRSERLERSGIADVVDREWWASAILDPEELDEVENADEVATADLYFSHVPLTDPQLEQVWDQTATENAVVLFTNPTLDWLVRPEGQCVGVATFNTADLDRLKAAEHASGERWGIEEGREPLLDLAEVAAYVEGRRAEWGRRGVTVTEGPQYRCWDGDDIYIRESLPTDLAATDWFFVELANDDDEVTVTVHDTGTCDVAVFTEDEALEATLSRDRQHAGALDLRGVGAVLEGVASALGATSE